MPLTLQGGGGSLLLQGGGSFLLQGEPPSAGMNVYAGIYPYLREILGDSVHARPDADFDLVIAETMRAAFAAFPTSTYAALTGFDKANVDEAIGKWAAIRRHSAFTTGGMNGSLTYENVTGRDNTRITRQTDNQYGMTFRGDVRTQYRREARQAWHRFSLVATARENGEPVSYGEGGAAFASSVSLGSGSGTAFLP